MTRKIDLESLTFLDAHQREGIQFALARPACYLAHPPGAGKTLEAILTALITEQSHPTMRNPQHVFIVPPTLTLNWSREVMKWFDILEKNFQAWPILAVIPETCAKDQADFSARFLIVPDSMITREWVREGLEKEKRRLLMVAVDEASRFKDHTAQRTVSLFGGMMKKGERIRGITSGAKRVVLLDGSPMPNRSIELWAPIYALAKETLGRFASYNDFGFRYCGATMNAHGNWEFKGSTRNEELHARLKGFMHRVSESVLKHPERMRSIVYISKDVRSATLKKWDAENLAKVSLGDVLHLEGTPCRTASPQDESASPSENKIAGELAKCRLVLGISKAKWCADYVSDLITSKGESILVFAWHREVVLGLEKALKKHGAKVVLGGTKKEEREKAIAEFQDGTIKVMVMNILSGGRGHNLQNADRAVFCEWAWSDETNIQAEKRASRKGSTKSRVRCDYIVAPNSLDEITLGVCFKKAKRVESVIGN